MNIAAVWSNVWPYLLAVLLFGIIITIHEFGHFFFAKLFKVRVNEFALGMGPAILKKKIGETQYALRLFPIGGFVSMEGETEESEDSRAFNNKPAWQRFIIVAAGALLNLILGLVVVGICLSMNDLVGTRRVHSFMDGATSVNCGLCENDEIIKINGANVYSSNGISYNMVRDRDNKIDITVRRDGRKIELKDVEFAQFEFEGKQYIQQDFYIVGEEPSFTSVVKNAFLESASIIQMVRYSFVDLCTGKYGIKDVSGPVGAISAIAETTSQAETVKDKLLTAFNLLSMITINVGVFNLFPIPALDGCALLLIVVEMIRKKKIPYKTQAKITAVGLSILLGFMAIVTISDIIKVIKG